MMVEYNPVTRVVAGMYQGNYGLHRTTIEYDPKLRSWYFAIDGEESKQGQPTLYQAHTMLNMNLHLLHTGAYRCTCRAVAS